MLFKKKYRIRYYKIFNNHPYNDAYFTLGKSGELPFNHYERIRIWTKESKLNALIEKGKITKEDIINSCIFKSQKTELLNILK